MLKAKVLPVVALVALVLVAGAGAGNGGWKSATGTGSSFMLAGGVTPRGTDRVITVTGGGGLFAGTLRGAYGLDPSVWVIHADGSSRISGTGITTAVIGDCGAVPGGVRYTAVLVGRAHADGSVSYTGTAHTVPNQGADYRMTLTGEIPAKGATSTFSYAGRYRCANSSATNVYP